MSKLIHLLLARRQLVLKQVRVEGERAKVLAEAHPAAQDAEARRLLAAQGQGAIEGPRAGCPPTIDIPLDTRTRTLLGHLEPQLRPGTHGAPPNKGRSSSGE